MGLVAHHDRKADRRGLIARLACDRAGNVMPLIAAGIVPLLAMIGGGVDMGRSYLAQSRLQQACDAGVLAARKKLGAQVVVNGDVPAAASDAGNRFFNINFGDGAYGTDNRAFDMTLEEDYSVSGVASADVPTSIMSIFGYSNVALSVACQAKLNFSNTDIMFVLDTTGSMAETNPSDSVTRMEAMRTVVQSFHAQIEAAKTAGTIVRYGFVPYSTNVNVGGLLEDDWVVADWKYQSRERVVTGQEDGTRSYDTNWVTESGTWSDWTTVSSYAGTYHPETSTYDPGGTTVDKDENVVTTPPGWRTVPAYYTCDGAQPADTLSESNKVLLGTTTEPYAGPPAGTRTIEKYRTTYNGTDYRTNLNGNTCDIQSSVADDWIATYDWVTDPTRIDVTSWRYAQLPKDTSNWRSETNGCIEERSTYEITDYTNVDLTRALDLDIDLVPTSDESTKWRPMYPNIVFARSMYWGGGGSFTPSAVITDDDFVNLAEGRLSACPGAARKLAAMSAQDVSDYVNALEPRGATYHDIGMIWGGRLISPTGLFAAENADDPGNPSTRHIIFLTDGETAPRDLSYSSYGVEPLDQRRWSSGSALSLSDTVENRFGVACAEVRKRNVVVWIVGFGTKLNPVMTDCAGPGHFFEADDSDELNSVFSRIAASMGDLRISK